MGRNRTRSRSRSRERRRERSRDRDRRRSRSRSRDRRSRRRTRSRSRSREKSAPQPDLSAVSAAAQVQALQVAQLQQQQLQRQLLTQQLLLSGSLGGFGALGMAGGGMAAGLATGKKQREVYVGNLTIGVVTDVMLRELFNAALAHFVPNPLTNPPVVSVGIDPTGRFAFVEMRTEELATEAMKLDKVELCGRHINVGRPKGYVEPVLGVGASPATVNMAQAFATTHMTQPTRNVVLENLLMVGALRQESERNELKDEVLEECQKLGTVDAIVVPKPSRMASDDEPGRVFVRFAEVSGAEQAKNLMHGRTFDGNKVVATFVTDDIFEKAERGEWTDRSQFVATTPPAALPGTPTPSLPLLPSVGLPTAIPVAGLASIAAAPSHGWVKLRGMPFTATKNDIIEFFRGCGTLTEDNVKIVLGIDGRPSGEAFVQFASADSNFPAALAKDRQLMPNSSRYVEIFPSSQDEAQRRCITGALLI